jgi:hypothetical protein
MNLADRLWDSYDGGSAFRKSANYTQHKHRNDADMIRAYNGIRTHHLSVGSGEEISCLDRTATVVGL